MATLTGPGAADHEFAVVDPTSPDAVAALTAYFDELDRRFPEGFDPGDTIVADADAFRPPAGRFVVVHGDTGPVACGGVTALDPRVAEIKRMWVAPRARGRGLGRAMLGALEEQARELGCRTVWLDTNTVLNEAIAMYTAAGYRPIDRYNDNPYAKAWFERHL